MVSMQGGRDEDPRVALLAKAEEAAANPQYIATAYEVWTSPLPTNTLRGEAPAYTHSSQGQETIFQGDEAAKRGTKRPFEEEEEDE